MSDYSTSRYDYGASRYDYGASRYWLLLSFLLLLRFYIMGWVCISYLLAMQCDTVCRRPIEERIVHALGKAWHVEVRQRGVV